MTEAEFLAWQSGREQRYELVDGVPRAMTGARIRHDIARGNADRHLAPQPGPQAKAAVRSAPTSPSASIQASSAGRSLGSERK
jgi:hypothetical protein